MDTPLVIVGAGIGGLATALAWGQAWRERRLPTAQGAMPALLLEQAERFSEVGTGLQLGPNATRLLAAWGLEARLRELAAYPLGLRVVDASDARELAHLQLGRSFRERHGGDYLTLHRADLHSLLLGALEPELVTTRSGVSVSTLSQTRHQVLARLGDGAEPIRAPALVACDGVWSPLREQLLADGPAPATGHLAFRALLDGADLPATVRHDHVTVWWGPRMHAVAYPVRSGQLMNLVVILHQADTGLANLDPGRRWDIDAQGGVGLAQALRGLDPALLDLVGAAPAWTLWRLHDRPPMDGPAAMAQGRVALLGDAAHPMLPYMAQGAAMAIEDAWVLVQQLMASPQDPAAAFARYAQARWRRAARVQRKSRLNGRIFHARGPLRTLRNLALRALGERLLDTPWLYGHRMA